MVFDNRFIPLFQRFYVHVPCYPSRFCPEGFFARATEAYDNNGEEIPLPLLFGPFDQAELGRSFIKAGLGNPFLGLPDKVIGKVPWNIDGKLQAQGFSFSYQQQLGCDVSCGISALIMHVNSRQIFFFDDEHNEWNLVGSDRQEFDRILREMFKELNLSCGFSEQFGPGDLDIYLRYNREWDYTYKMRHIYLGLRLGALVGTGEKRDTSKPTSIPFGGNGHSGIYGSIDAEFEIKEDMTAGFLLRASKRFAKTQRHRLPVGNEPSIFGVEVGNARVSPGATVIFSPYIYFENLRKGFGAGIRYFLTSHQEDSWCDKRPESRQKEVPVNLKEVQELSKWGSDYVSLTAFYDTGKLETSRGFRPIFSATWNIPTSWFVARGVAKTTEVTLAVDFNF